VVPRQLWLAVAVVVVVVVLQQHLMVVPKIQ
jgi:hypothetical protein